MTQRKYGISVGLFNHDGRLVLFHEAIGHRLEADRLRQASDGKTFLKKVGQRILPAFLTVPVLSMCPVCISGVSCNSFSQDA